jgi:hypothetical protein
VTDLGSWVTADTGNSDGGCPVCYLGHHEVGFCLHQEKTAVRMKIQSSSLLLMRERGYSTGSATSLKLWLF